jgi:hypothetical protein
MLKGIPFSPSLPGLAGTRCSPSFLLASIKHKAKRTVKEYASAFLSLRPYWPASWSILPRYDCALLGVCVTALQFCLADQSFAEWPPLTEAKVLYTDNVFEFSAARRLQISEDPSQPTVVPLNRPSDLVWGPSIDVRRTLSSRLGQTEVSFKAHGFIFTNNPIFRHSDYRIQVNH